MINMISLSSLSADWPLGWSIPARVGADVLWLPLGLWHTGRPKHVFGGRRTGELEAREGATRKERKTSLTAEGIRNTLVKISER